MIAETKERPAPDTDDVVGHVRSAVAPVGDRDRSLGHRHILAVHISGAVRPNGCRHPARVLKPSNGIRHEMPGISSALFCPWASAIAAMRPLSASRRSIA